LPEGEVAGTLEEADKSQKPGSSHKPGSSDAPRSKQFQVSVRVTDESVGEIPALAYSWFDPDTQSYQTTRSKPIALRVMPAKVVSAADVVSSTPGDASRSPASPKSRASSQASSEGGNDASQVALAAPVQSTFSLSGADLAVEPDAGVVLRDSADRVSGFVLSTVVYAVGLLLLLLAALVDRKRRDADPAVVSRLRNVRHQHSRIARAAGLPKQRAAEEIAAAVRALLAEQPDVARAEAETVIAQCESVAYALPGTGDGTLDAALVQRATAVADRFQQAARLFRKNRASRIGPMT
jgi:hypothetical protein